MKVGRFLATPLGAALVAALVALAVRGALVAHGTDLPPDGVFDLEIARDLQHGDWRGAVLRRFHPLEGALAAVVASALGRSADERCGLVVTVAAGTLAAFFAALAAGRAARTQGETTSAFAALAAGLLVAAHPTLARSAATVWSYPLSHAALAVAVWASVGAVMECPRLSLRALRAAFGAGVAVGFAYLARPDGLVILAGLVAGLIVLAVRSPPGGSVRARGLALLLPLAVVAGFALPAAPYVLALRSVTGEWRITLKKDERHLVGMRDLQAPPPARPAADDLASLVSAAEGHEDVEETGLAASALYVLRRSGESVNWLLVLLGAAGVVAGATAATRFAGGGVLLAFFAAHTLLKANERHLNGNHPSAEAVIFAIWGGLALAPLVRSRSIRTVVLGASVALLLAKTRDTRSIVKTELTRTVAAALRDRREPGRELVLCGRDARPLAFLAGARLVEMPRGDAASVASAARGAGARFLAVYVRSHGDPPAPVTSALAGAGLPPPERFTATRAADKGAILYTWLVYDLSGEKR